MRGRLGTLPVATIGLIVVTVAAFGLLSAGESRLALRCHAVEYGLVPYELTHPGARLTDPWCEPQGEAAGAAHEGHDHPSGDPGLTAKAPAWITPATSLLVHGGVGSLLGTVLFTWALGAALERRVRAVGVVAAYAAGGLAAAATLIALAPDLPFATVGASGAVAALLAGCAVICPRARLTALEIPVPVVAGAWIASQAALAWTDAAQPAAGAGGDIAYLAPAGGLAAGALLTAVLAGRIRRHGAHPIPVRRLSHAQHRTH